VVDTASSATANAVNQDRPLRAAIAMMEIKSSRPHLR